MPIDISRDRLLPYAALAQEVPGPKKPNPGSVYRWHRLGLRGHHLELVLVNGQMVGTVQGLMDFLRAVNEGPKRKAKPKTAAASRKRAKRVLDRAGI